MADGSTKYLSEVRPGDAVLVATCDVEQGTPAGVRAAVVGRCKVEPRPTLMVSFADGARSGQLFLQQAETVRLGRAQTARHGSKTVVAAAAMGVPVTELNVGEQILVRWRDEGTHVGRSISARVEER